MESIASAAKKMVSSINLASVEQAIAYIGFLIAPWVIFGYLIFKHIL